MSSTDGNAAAIKLQDNRLIVSGELTFDSVPALAKQLPVILQSVTDVSVDCSQVSDSNSAGLALLLEMSRIMRARNQPVRFSAIPAQLQTVARAYGLIESEASLEDTLQS